ncbi:ninjurin-1 isoform X1 [Neomonachus schauinslandi]|uniref:Ninjurin-1 isoform X1 n=1 Tax=Neomonachus schauinslandi TaxID=29088 RepID=A0A2Y9HKQ8_NEOSC|nr:ninjurin-1 isoform X1 [Neomonachus schauinslandi]
MESGPEEYELNGGLRPGSPGSPDASPSRWGRNRPINVNHYANKKSAAESMLDIALLMANASQLKAVIEQGPAFAFFVPLVVLISISLVLQIGVGVLLIFLGVSLGWGGGPCGGPAHDLLVLLVYPPGQGAHHLTGPTQPCGQDVAPQRAPHVSVLPPTQAEDVGKRNPPVVSRDWMVVLPPS